MIAPDRFILYRAGYKYQLVQDYTEQTIITGWTVFGPFVTLTVAGLLTCKAGYAWDGPSGPVPDDPRFMRASLVHDALYQLMRESLITDHLRRAADYEFRRILLEDRVERTLADAMYVAVRNFGAWFADPLSAHGPLRAPLVPPYEPAQLELPGSPA